MSIRQSDHQRFQALFDAHFDEIRGYCLRRLSTSEANDAVSEVFMTAWRRIKDVPADEAARLWLFGVARNTVMNRHRSQRRSARLQARLASLGAPPSPGVETQVIAAAEHDDVLRALKTLNARDLEVVRLRLWEELSVADTATVLNINPKAAAKRYARALQRVERSLSSHDEERATPRRKGGAP